jgi:hypothetical protein
MEKLIEQIKRIAEENQDGFTILLPDLKHAKRGWVVALKETQNSFGDQGLKKVIEVATEAIGGWKYGDLFYWDAVIILYNKEEAVKIGRENEQIGIFNIETATYLEL